MTLKYMFDELRKKKGKAFMAHVYCGDPSVEFSERVIRELEGSIDLLELGIPFSDPLADGTVFQQACQRAIAAGATPKDVFSLAKRLRKDGFEKPIVLTTYYNIVFRMGLERFVSELKDAGIQGVIVPDLPFEESGQLRELCEENAVALISIIAPTTDDARVRDILRGASGFVYLVSVTGVTGTDKKAGEDLKAVVRSIRKHSRLPVLIGFGIAGQKQVEALKTLGVDGVIVGSEICRLYQESIEKVRPFAEEIRRACQKI